MAREARWVKMAAAVHIEDGMDERAHHERVFQTLYPLLIQEKHWEEALAELPGLLMKRLALIGERAAHFLGDFAVFSHFIRARCLPIDKRLPSISVESLWHFSADASAERYQILMLSLFQNVIPEFHTTRFQDWGSLRHALSVFDALTRLLPQRAATEVSSIQGTFAHWVLRICQAIADFIWREVSLTAPVYRETVDKMWFLIQSFALTGLPQACIHAQRCYQAIAEHYETQGTAPRFLTRMASRIKSLIWRTKIASTLTLFREELHQLKEWSMVEAKALLLTPGVDKGVAFINAYTRMQGRFSKLGERAFKQRCEYEQAIRGTTHYLTRLTLMDEGFMALHAEIDQAKAAWFQSLIEFKPHDDFYSRARDCCRIFNTTEALRLESMVWVYHTAYAWQRTEGTMAHEMEARNIGWWPKKFLHYTLDASYTLSDFIIMRAEEVLKDIKRTLLAQVHPDRIAPGDLAERVVRDYCSKALGASIDTATKMLLLWHKGQWSSAPPRTLLLKDGSIVEEENKIDDAGAEPVEDGFVTMIEAPTEALSLSILADIHDYRAWVERQGTLVKPIRGQRIEFMNDFYTGPAGDGLRRALFTYHQGISLKHSERIKKARAIALQCQRDSPRLKREAAEAEQKAAEAGQKAAEAEQKAAEAEQKAAEAGQKAASAERREDTLLHNYLIHKMTKKMRSGMNGEVLQNRLNEVIESGCRTFSTEPATIRTRILEIVRTTEGFAELRPEVNRLFSEPSAAAALAAHGHFSAAPPLASIQGEEGSFAASLQGK